MYFDDEPTPGDLLPILKGHVSPGRLERILRAGEFVVTAELSPPDSADPDEVPKLASIFDGYVDALNATDGSGANCHMSSIGVCALLARMGYESVMQISCRDRNRIAIQGDVLGAAAMGVANIMTITGDGIQAGDHPDAKPVFDLESTSALQIIRSMRDESRFLSGRTISSPPKVFLGAAANPFVPPIAFRPLRLEKKVAAGAQFIQTQYCFDVPMLKTYMTKVRDMGLDEKVFILVGVGPIRSLKSALWMRDKIPGVHVPDAIIKRLKGARDQRQEGKQICIETIQQVKEIAGVNGVHVMAFRQEELVAEIIQESNVLAGRVPWYPGRD